jgi:hypothetical protein
MAQQRGVRWCLTTPAGRLVRWCRLPGCACLARSRARWLPSSAAPGAPQWHSNATKHTRPPRDPRRPSHRTAPRRRGARLPVTTDSQQSTPHKPSGSHTTLSPRSRASRRCPRALFTRPRPEPRPAAIENSLATHRLHHTRPRAAAQRPRRPANAATSSAARVVMSHGDRRGAWLALWLLAATLCSSTPGGRGGGRASGSWPAQCRHRGAARPRAREQPASPSLPPPHPNARPIPHPDPTPQMAPRRTRPRGTCWPPAST